MRNTTIADLIKGIHDMDRTLAMPKRAGLSKLRKAELTKLHCEVLEHFLKVTQPEVDAILAEKFYACEPCGGTNVLIASREEHERRHHTASPQSPVGLGGEFDDEQDMTGHYAEQGAVQEPQEFVPLRQNQEKIISRKAIGPVITVVCRVGRKLVMGEVVSTVSRPMAMDNKNLVAVRHLSDLGYPRVTLHAPKELAY